MFLKLLISKISAETSSTELSLRHLYGDKKAFILIQEFKKINELIFDNPKKHNDGYGRAFEVFALAVYMGITYEQALNYTINGDADGKIDAVVWDDTTVYIYQIKMNTIIGEGVLEKAKKNYKEFLTTGTLSGEHTSDLLDFLEKHALNIKGKGLKVCSISNAPTTRNNISSKDLFDKYFNNILIPQKASNIILEIKLDEAIDEETGNTYTNCAKTDSNTFLFANANQLLNCLYEQGVKLKTSDKLFYDNVRGFMGVNATMQDTIKNNPEKMGLYPDPDSVKLNEAIAKMLNQSGGVLCNAKVEGKNVFPSDEDKIPFTVTPDMIYSGNGSDEVLSFIFYAF